MIHSLGKRPEHIFKLRVLATDSISAIRLKLLRYIELEVALELSPAEWNLLATFHPAILRINLWREDGATVNSSI